MFSNNVNTNVTNFDDYGGVDPSIDPELAMAIRVSTEEARAKEEAKVNKKLLFLYILV
jgi:hypothetical protein